VSSLTESFMSGVPLGSEDGVLIKGKRDTPTGASTQDENSMSHGDITVDNGRKLTEKDQDEGDESGELTEQSDDEGGMLEVHD